VSLCDIGTDGFFITYGSREDIEKIAHYLTEKNIPGNTAPCRCRGSRSNHHDQGSHHARDGEAHDGAGLDRAPPWERLLQLRDAGASLRSIAEETSLGFRTVRTIVEKRAGTDRTSKKNGKLRRRELDNARMASWRARKRVRDALPKQITESRKRSAQAGQPEEGVRLPINIAQRATAVR
jgi:hypothetical protein